MSEPIEHSPGPWIAEVDRAFSWVTSPHDGQSTFPPVVARDLLPDNCLLIALAPTAPHVCADPACPGDINRRKLEAYDALVSACKHTLPIILECDPDTAKIYGAILRTALRKA